VTLITYSNLDSDTYSQFQAIGFTEAGRCQTPQDLQINEGEEKNAIKQLKDGKAPGTDGVLGEMLKAGGEAVVKWMARISFRSGVVPRDRRRACVVPIYKGKGERTECKNYRGISMLSIGGKVYGRVLVDRVVKKTEGRISDEQGGFRKGRGCVDQVFALRNVSEKNLEKQKDLYLGFMDLEKAYDKVDREGLWEVLIIYGVSGKLVQAVKSFYEESEACVRVCREESEWFDVRQG
jgi:hypothetical protein